MKPPATNSHLETDWCHYPMPENIRLGPNVYIDSAYNFAAFHSRRRPGLEMGEGSGAYAEVAFITGPEGSIAWGRTPV